MAAATGRYVGDAPGRSNNGRAHRARTMGGIEMVAAGDGRGSRARTRDLRFWRPSLYQLSYTPIRMSRYWLFPGGSSGHCPAAQCHRQRRARVDVGLTMTILLSVPNDNSQKTTPDRAAYSRNSFRSQRITRRCDPVTGRHTGKSQNFVKVSCEAGAGAFRMSMAQKRLRVAARQRRARQDGPKTLRGPALSGRRPSQKTKGARS